jgi:hypothetical protein
VISEGFRPQYCKKVSENLNPATQISEKSCKNDKSGDIGLRISVPLFKPNTKVISEGFRSQYWKKVSENLNPAT